MGMGCKACEECGCEPNIIDNNCNRCLSCSQEEGDLRWGSITPDGKKVEVGIRIKTNKEKQDEKTINELMQPIEVKA